MYTKIDLQAFEYAIQKIDDGWVFEEFAQQFLSATIGTNFIPVGGSKDKGIDGFEHLFKRKDREKYIYQFSTELNSDIKIEDTIKKLKKNGITFSKLYFATNRKVNNKDKIIDKLEGIYEVSIAIYDCSWFKAYANSSESTIRAYNIFIDSHVHEFLKPGKEFFVANLDTDPRLYVYLREQLNNDHRKENLDYDLIDAMILYVLEGTDPDINIFKSKEEIKSGIRTYIKFEDAYLNDLLDKRLYFLTRKPNRKITFHTKTNGYCLPYDIRCEIRDRDIKDALLLENFQIQTQKILKKYLHDENIVVKDVTVLINSLIHQVFYQQGLEFANFIINHESKNVVEKDLQGVISKVVDESQIINKNKEKVKVALLMTIRDIVYNGSIEQKQYLKCLSNTYLMMFMLQWDPKLAIYFKSLASKLNIYVCTSIIIPALSEIYLNSENKRHWNLLKSANNAGISLKINETILGELLNHFRMIKSHYKSNFAHCEKIYLNDEIEFLYIDDILIRSYFYSKKEGKVSTFDDFIDNFLSPDFKTAKEDIVIFLKDTFGITYIPNSELDIKINKEERGALLEKLKDFKPNYANAENDSELILAIYKLREKFNETAQSTIFGYKTWWLSKDTSTYRAVVDAFGTEKFPISCYIRPDFIYNYITLTPQKDEVDNTYQKLFPSMLGVNISYHLPDGVAQVVQTRIVEHKDKSPERMKAILRRLSEQLKSDPKIRSKKAIEHYLDQELKKITEIDSNFNK